MRQLVQFVFLFLYCSLIGLGQVTKIDSLTAASKFAKRDQRPKIYSDLCWEYRFISADSALYYGKKAIAAAKEIEDRAGIAQGYNDLSIIHILTGNLDTAEVLLKEALKIRVDLKDTLSIAAVQNKLAIIAQKRGDLRGALNYNLQTLKIYEASGDIQKQAIMLNNIGIIHNNLSESEQARKYLRRSYNMKIEVKDSSEAAGTLVNLGNTYETETRFDSALFYFSLSRDILIACNGSPEYLAGAYNSLGRMAQQLGNKTEALKNYELALQFRQAVNDKQALSKTYLNLAELYLDNLELKKAKDLLDSAKVLILQTNTGLERLALFKDLARYYALTNQADSSYHYAFKAYTTRDSLLGEESRKTVAELETQYETEKKERAIAELNQKRAEDALKITRQRGWTYGLFGAILLLGIAGWLFYDRKRQQAAAELAETEARLNKKLLETNILAQEEERRRIAKEIHDGLVQSIAVLKLNIQHILNNESFEMSQRLLFGEHFNQLDLTAEEARNISHQMMPRTLIENGLTSALEDMLSKSLTANQISFSLEHFGIGNDRFKPAVEVGLYRIAQEMVNNIIKHSKASNVFVQLYKTKGHLILHVEDDGCGFDFDSMNTQNGIGMHNIFSRAKAVDGEVKYQKALPRGTMAIVRIPLKNLID
jgi:signal transduction histidine kinase